MRVEPAGNSKAPVSPLWNPAPMAVSFEERVQRLLRPGASGPPLTGEAVEEAERVLGVTLPSDLLVLLRRQNGGYVRQEFAACPTTRPTNWADDHVLVNEIAGIGSTGVLSLLDAPSLNEEWGQPPELVLLSGEGHWWIALDYRGCGPGGEPPVVLYENDSEGSPDELRLAPSFREFVCMLGPEPPDDVSLDPAQVKSVWIDPDFAREHGL
jgi:hypothetical protein